MDPGTIARPELDIRPCPRRTDYGIGIIGCGWVVKNYHIPAYRARGLNVVAVADLQPGELDFVRDRFGIEQCFRDYREMLALPEVEIVDLSTRTPGRVEIVEQCAAAGKHLLVQKPFARSMDEGRAMVAAANRAGVKLGVNSHYRWLNVFRGAWQLIRQGVIGDIYYIGEEMVGDQDRVYYEVMHDRRWNAELDDFMNVEWGAHHFDFLRFWTGQTPSSVYCTGTRRPGQNFKGPLAMSFSVNFPSGAVASLAMNQTSVCPAGRWSFRIDGSKGVIEGCPFSTLRVMSKEYGDEWIEWDLTGPGNQVRDDSYLGTMGDLMDAITEDRPHISSGEDNLNTVRAYLAGYRSYRERRLVHIDEVI